MPIKVNGNEVNSRCLKIQTLALAGKFQVFFKYFERVFIFFCCISYFRRSRGLLGPFSNLMERGSENFLRYTRCIFREQQGCLLCKIA